jgi:hypothetical protein
VSPTEIIITLAMAGKAIGAVAFLLAGLALSIVAGLLRGRLSTGWAAPEQLTGSGPRARRVTEAIPRQIIAALCPG